MPYGTPSKQGSMHNNDGWQLHTFTHNQQQQSGTMAAMLYFAYLYMD
jgi:hypothetical protein